MNIVSNAVRVTLTSLALTAALSPGLASANSGLELKLLDGSMPINQPDLFASAYSKAWGDGTQFCAALKSLLAQSDPNFPVVTSCHTTPYGNTGVVSSSTLKAQVDFTAVVTLQGTAPFYKDTCAFTDTINVEAQDALIASDPAQPPRVATLTFSAPTVVGKVVREDWALPCTSSPSQHPGGLADRAAITVQTAASNVNFPGNALNEALAPFQSTVAKDLTSMIYNISTATGDIDIQVVDSFLHEKLTTRLPTTAASASGSSTVNSGSIGSGSSVWGAQPAVAPGANANTASKWGVPAGSSTAPAAGSSFNRNVSSSLQQARPLQTPATQPVSGTPQ